jgi:hypothetical protein
MTRPPRPPALRLQDWLAWINQRSGLVTTHPAPEVVGPKDHVYYYRPGELVVRHDTPEVLTAVKDALRDAGATVAETTPVTGLPITLIQLTADSPTVPTLLAALQTDKELKAIVSPNYVGFPALVLNGAPWVNGGPGGAPAAVPDPGLPTLATGSVPTAKMLVLDTGLWAEVGNARTWMTKVSGTWEDPYSPGSLNVDLFDCHGMFVAGIAAGTIQDGSVAVVDVFDNAGAVSDVDLGAAINGALAAAPAGTRVVNFSGGIYAPPEAVPQTLKAVVDHSDVLFVAAAGNLPDSGVSGPFYPAAFGADPAHPNVVGVGALAAGSNVPATFSNTDACSAQVWARGADVVNAFAPTVTVQLPDNTTVAIKGNTARTAKWSGTSFAAPLVAGMMARYMLSSNASAERDKAVDWLTSQGWATKTATGLTVVSIP